MEKNNLVSVVIPVYNSEKFLIECLDSVLNQTYKDIEIIVVNDGSTDGSEKILQKYSDKITIISQENQGLASALNTGIKIMKGKWFKWFSPDDVMFPECIAILVKTTENLSDNTIIYSNWDIIDENGKELRQFTESNYNQLKNFDFNVRLLDGQQINVNTALIPTMLFSKGCLFQNLKNPVAIDYDFFLRAGILYDLKFYLVEQNLLKYRVHTNQLSHKNIKDSLFYLESVRTQILSELDPNQKEKYLLQLNEYDKNKPLVKKTMDSGLKFVNRAFPNWISDKLIVFYLNKIRRSR